MALCIIQVLPWQGMGRLAIQETMSQQLLPHYVHHSALRWIVPEIYISAMTRTSESGR